MQELGGIPSLVNLLDSPNPQVSQTAAGALRNLVFKNQVNKMEVYDCGGVAKALNLLKKTDSTETKKQITGRNLEKKITSKLLCISGISNAKLNTHSHFAFLMMNMERHCILSRNTRLLLLFLFQSKSCISYIGLLWNLSSEDKLKQDLMDTALPALTERVAVPFISNDDKEYVDSTVFYNATGCLR